MRKISLDTVVASESSSIKEVMRLIDRSGIRVAYIVDRNGKLLGSVSDGEIRRSILKGKDIKDAVKSIIYPTPVVLYEKDLSNKYSVRRAVKKIRERMPDSRFLLVLDPKRHPKGLVAISSLLEKDLKDKKDNEHAGKHVLVVGGAGYLGSVLVRQLLNKGFKVRVLDILMFGIEPIRDLLNHERFQFIEGDMRNISTIVRALADVDAVINLAAVVGDPACFTKPEMAIETNYLSNKALAEACKYHQINRFIYASTCSVYGAADGDKGLDENSSLNPVSLYARSKIQSEEGILDLEDENFSPTILRMSTLYGYSPRMRFDLVVNTMTKNAIMDHKIIVHGGGKQWRPLLHVEDAARSYVQCLEAPLKVVKGAVFNVGSRQQNYQIFTIAEAVKECVPQAHIVHEGEAKDLRNYIVSFARIEKKLKFKVAHQLKESIQTIKKAIEDKEIHNVADPKYYNVEYITNEKS